MNKLAKKIFDLMNRESVSKLKIANSLEIDVAIIDGWENGTGRPHLKQLPMIAKVLNVSLDELVICTNEKKAVELLTEYSSLHDMACNHQVMSAISSVLPFFDNQIIKDLYQIIAEQNSMDYGIKILLISNMCQNDIDEIATMAKNHDMRLFDKLLPFVSEDIIMELLVNFDVYDFKSIQKYLPYINEKIAEQIAVKYIVKYGASVVVQFFPYVSENFLNIVCCYKAAEK